MAEKAEDKLLDDPEASLLDEDFDGNASPGKTPWAIMVAIVLITLVAIWLVPSDEEPEPEDIPLPGEPAEMRGDNNLVTESGNAGDMSPGATARTFIRILKQSGGSPDDAYDEAERQQGAGNLADAYLLYFYAARNGHALASMKLAEQADPAYFKSGGSILDAADIEQSYKWYDLADKAGAPGANERLGALIQHIEQLADAGDEKAQRLMLQWK